MPSNNQTITSFSSLQRKTPTGKSEAMKKETEQTYSGDKDVTSAIDELKVDDSALLQD